MLYGLSKKYILFAILHLLFVQVKAQTINVINSKTKEPIPYCNVSLMLLQGKQTINTQANEKGSVNFNEKLIGAEVVLKITSVFTAPFNDTIYLKHTNSVSVDESSHNLSSVTVTAQYSPTTEVKSVHKVKVITAEKIKAMSAQNLRDVLGNELNIRLQQDNVLGTGMSLQGVSGENVKILIDGVPIIGRQNGNLDLSQINVNNIERIEIIEGPLSVNYGTNALAGTINIIMKKESSNKFTSTINSYYESIGQYNINARLSTKVNTGTVTLSGGRNYFDGWNSTDEFTILPKSFRADSGRFKQWKPKEQYFADGFYNLIKARLTVNYRFGVFSEKITNRGYPIYPYNEKAFDDYYFTHRFDNAISAIYRLPKHTLLTSQAAYNNYQRIKNTYFNDLTTLNKEIANSYDLQDTALFTLLNIRSIISHKKDSSKLDYELGVDINMENGQGKRIAQGKNQINDYAIFGSLQYNPNSKIIIRPGVRCAYNSVFKVPPIASLNFKYLISNTHSIRFSYAQGFRAPSLKELYLDFVDINHNIVGNTDLMPEKSHNFTAVMSYASIKKNSVWKTDNTIFFNYIQNLITLGLTSPAKYSYINIGTYKTMGIQINSERSWENFKVTVGASYIGQYNQLSEQYHINKFSYSPEARANMAYTIQKTKTTFNVFYKYSGATFGYSIDANKNILQTKIGNYNMMDANVNQNFCAGKFLVGVGCKNLFNITNVFSNASTGVHSSGTTSVPMATGRLFFIKVEFNFRSKK